MPSIKIAYLIDTIISNTAGTERQLLEIIKRLDRRLFESSLICLYESPWMKANKVPCPVYTLGYRGFIKANFPDVVKRLAALIREREFHVLHTFFDDSIFVAYLASFFRAARPTLLSSRRDIGLGGVRPWYHSLYQVVLPLVNRRFRGIVVNSQAIKAHTIAREKVPEEKVTVLYNGVDIPPGLEVQPPLFRDHPRDLWIGVTANLKPVKRIDVFLKALSLLKTRCGEIDFGAVILGEGPERERLIQMCHELGLDSRVYFPGAVLDVVSYLQQLDIGVLCSDKEGFSNALLEYMACGLPVVVTSTGGNMELVDETNGILFPPGKVRVLSEAMIRLAVNPALRQRMGESSTEKVRKHYSWERAIHYWEEYYREQVSVGAGSRAEATEAL